MIIISIYIELVAAIYTSIDYEAVAPEYQIGSSDRLPRISSYANFCFYCAIIVEKHVYSNIFSRETHLTI